MSNKIYVWDPLVRFSHWTLVIAFTIAYLTGEEESTLHVYSGYYILGLIAIRVVWGLIGTRYARFSHFVFSPAATIDYLKGFIGQGSGKKYRGHNPAGSWMVIIMLVSLLATGLSGLQVYGLEGYGPLAQTSATSTQTATTNTTQQAGHFIKVSSDDDENKNGGESFWEEVWEEIHELFANFTVLLVLLHIGGVVASSVKQKQNLVKAMINGYKRDE